MELCGDCPEALAARITTDTDKSNIKQSPIPSTGPRFTFKVNGKTQVRTLQYTMNNETTDIAHTKLVSPEVKAHKDSELKVKNESVVVNSITPTVSRIKITIWLPPKLTKHRSLLFLKLALPPSSDSALSFSRGDGSTTSTSDSKVTREETSLTDVTSGATSLGDISSPLGNDLQTRLCDTATRHEIQTTEKTVQTESFLEINFMNKFDLNVLLKNMRNLLMDNNIQTGKFTENYLRNKFLSSFLSSFQNDSPSESQKDKLSRRDTTTVNSARRATPNRVSKPTKPSSLPKPVGSRLKSLNSPLKTVGGSRRFSRASPQPFRGVKKQIVFKPY